MDVVNEFYLDSKFNKNKDSQVPLGLLNFFNKFHSKFLLVVINDDFFKVRWLER